MTEMIEDCSFYKDFWLAYEWEIKNEKVKVWHECLTSGYQFKQLYINRNAIIAYIYIYINIVWEVLQVITKINST